MIEVTRKDAREPLESILRRFTRKVQQAGTITIAKQGQFFNKPPTKRDRRFKAIIRRQRRAVKAQRSRLGLR